MQVPCHCQHAPWHLGANAKSFFAQLIEDPTHHILNETTLGGYQLLLWKIQGTQALIHYIERFTIQLVEYKALNLVDVGSSPMVEITSYTVIMNESYTKSQLDNILLTRPLGATRCWSSLHDHIYKVLAHYCIMTRPLGATSDMNIMEIYIFQPAENQMSISRPIFFTIFFCEKPMSANWLWSWPINPDFLEGNDKDLKMRRISLTWINPN